MLFADEKQRLSSQQIAQSAKKLKALKKQEPKKSEFEDEKQEQENCEEDNNADSGEPAVDTEQHVKQRMSHQYRSSVVPTPFFSERDGQTKKNSARRVETKADPSQYRSAQIQRGEEEQDMRPSLGPAEPAKKAMVSEDEMRKLIDAMQGNFNIVCHQLREA